jgi:hypothetical protein
MCETHTFYNLCGHVNFKAIVQCADMTENLLKSKANSTCNDRLCSNVEDDPHVVPDVCEECKALSKKIGGDTIFDMPAAKIDILQAWRKEHRPASKTDSARSGSGGISDHKDPDSDDETINAIPTSAVISTSSSASNPDTPASSTDSRPSSTTSNRSELDMRDIKDRVAALLARTERLITRIRAQKGTEDNIRR